MAQIRPPAVAGMFYPAAPAELRRAVQTYLDAAPGDGIEPRALIAPHAGYIYSGPVAACAYKLLVASEAARRVRRVALLGPSHFVPCRGLALSTADAFDTPLGRVPIDRPAADRIAALSQVIPLDAAHAREHSLEVHLPFLQTVLEDFRLVPLAVGDATPAEVAEVLDALLEGAETLLVISSDLSHYHPYDIARKLDAETAAAIEALRPEAIGRDRACGRIPIQGLLALARRKGWRVRRADLRNSGDTAGPREQVVGYGAWAFFD